MTASPVGAQRPLLVVGSARPHTGFDRVLSGLLPELSRRREVHQLAPNRPDIPASASWTTHCPNDPADPFGTRAFRELVQRLRPVALILHDVTVMPRYLDAIGGLPDPIVLAYCPIDGPLRAPSCLSWVPQVARLVVYTSSALRAVSASLGLDVDGALRPVERRVEIIPHGVDTDRFFPLHASPRVARMDARRELRQELGIDIAPECVVTLVVARNQARKRLDLAIRGFARRSSGDALLWLHTDVRGIGFDVMGLAHDSGIARRVVLTPAAAKHPGVDDRTLNLIYNACDIGLSTSCGEAWGLASFEHAATGAPQVMTGTDTAGELWPAGAILLDADRAAGAGNTFAGVAVRADAVANALDRLCSNPRLRAEIGRAALENARRREFRWESIAAQWERLIDRVQAEARRTG